MSWRIIGLSIFLAFTLKPVPAYADFFGGDLPLLAEIVANTAQQLTRLQSILGTGKDTLALLQDINRGVRDAMAIVETRNRTLAPGILSELRTAEQLLKAVEQLYGKVPRSTESKLQGTVDASVAESLHVHNEAYRYADSVDPEAERLKNYARDVSPLGAQKITAQALGVLIHVMNQVLRTNAAILKIQSEQLALQNRREKLHAEQHLIKYGELSQAFHDLKSDYRLPALAR